MTIGLVKIGKKVFYNDTSQDYASWSDEVVKIHKILEKYGHSMHILTENDLVITPALFDVYDRIYIFAGQGPLSAYQNFRDMTQDLRLIITDLRLKPEDLSIFDKVYSQSPELGIFLPPTFIFFNYKKFIDISKKTIEFYFGGGTRDRTKDFFEYVYKPDHAIRAKMTIDGEIIDNRVGREEHLRLLKSSKYSVVIADRGYNEIGFITMRHYENLMSNVISFVDSKYDKYEKIIAKDDYRRVNSYFEMRQKMDMLSYNLDEYLSLLSKQRDEILSEYIDGSHCYGIID